MRNQINMFSKIVVSPPRTNEIHRAKHVSIRGVENAVKHQKLLYAHLLGRGVANEADTICRNIGGGKLAVLGFGRTN